jgi:LmbE family N-acetylglucosaminyl deacetylase
MPPLDFTPQTRVMVIAPHPDDETLAAGGLLQRVVAAGGTARVIFATDGENNPWPQRYTERKCRITDADRTRWGVRRRGEAVAALACLGIPDEAAAFLGWPDQGLTGILLSGGVAEIERIRAEIKSWHPTLLVTPSIRDVHPDHGSLGVLVRLAIDDRVNCAEGFDVVSFDLRAPTDAARAGSGPCLRLTEEERSRKRSAILQHATQLKLSRRRFLAYASAEESYLAVAVGGRPAGGAGLSPHPSSRSVAGQSPVAVYHPVAGVARENAGTLRIHLEMRERPGAFGKGTLLIVGDGGARRCRIAVPIPSRSGETAGRDLLSGAAAGRCGFTGGRRRGELVVPSQWFAGMDRIFVSLKRRYGFFDEAGWIEIPLSERP